MQIGVVYPQTQYGSDPALIKDYAQTAEELGYTHILAYDHVLGANPERPGGWPGPYTYETPFLSPFLLFSYMAAVTARIGFATGILILPQRQTALVAKQAATLDVLSGGRLRLGVGTGWNEVEYVALGQDFHMRGKRQEAQVALLRKLWTQPLVEHEDEWHRIPDAGLNPLPVQQPIPIWFGGHHPNVLRRVAAMGDGWMPNYRSPADARPAWETVQGHIAELGRDPAEIGLEPRLHYGDANPDTWRSTMDEWRALGATHLTLNTMYPGFETAQGHLDAIRAFAEAML
jgi:probable F420-dependent oxidoreductase